MRIGMLGKFFPENDGIARFSENLCNQLFDKHKIVKIGDAKSGTKYKINFQSFSFKEKLAEIIKDENLNMLHVQYIPAYFGKLTLNLNFLGAMKQQVPVICTMHEVYQDVSGYSLPRKIILRWLEKRVATNAAAVVVHTPRQKEYFERKYGLKNVHHINLGLELREMHKRNGRNILFFGIISRAKGVELLLEAMEKMPDCSLRIVGSFVDSTHKEEISKLVAEHPYRDKISLQGNWVSDAKKWQHMEWADIVVLPYLQGHQSGVLNDAASCGLPVVVTKAGFVHEMAQIYGFGEVVDSNSESIERGIRAVFNNYRKYQGNLVKYREEANWKKIGERHIELYIGFMTRNFGE